MAVAAQPRQPQGRRQGLRQPLGAARRHARRRGGRPDRRRRAQRRRQVDAAAADRRRRGAGRRARSRAPAALHARAARPGRRPRRRRSTIRDELVGGRADHEWAADARFRDGARRAARRRRRSRASRTASTRRSRRCRAASGGGSRWPRRCSTTPSCCCSTSRPTTSTSRASTGSPATSPRAAARCSSSPTTAGSSTPSARTTWEVADGAVHQYEGGYAAYVLARAERDRQAAAREERRQQLLRKELAWLRRGPPARTSKPKFRIEAANALIADEPEPRDTRRAAALRRPRGSATRCSTPSDVVARLRRRGRCCATSPGGSARATASRWSASTARARRR